MEDVNSRMLRQASQQGDNERVKLLIRLGVEVDEQDERGVSSLHLAAANGHVAVVQTLVRANATINSQDRNFGASPLMLACQNGHVAVVHALISAKADVNQPGEDGRSPLHHASRNGHVAVAQALVSAGVTVNTRSRDHFGDSPLMLACQNGHVAVVKTLISANADVNLQRNSGASPLYMASQNGHVSVVKILVNSNADVNLQAIDGKSPLLAASLTGQVAVMQTLISANANINHRDNNGRTPLFSATLSSHTPAVKILLENGAHPHLRPHSPPFTPLQVACFTGCFDLVKVILVHYAEHNYDVSQSLSLSCVPAAAHCIARLPTRVEGVEGSVLEGFRSEVSDTHLSIDLHNQFKKAGFTCKISSLQSAAADVMQQIERKRMNKDEIFFVGSFSEGWGNSLTCLMGRTDLDSDIDVTEFVTGRLYHLSGRCRCVNVNGEETVEYKNGHVMVSGSAANPASQSNGSLLRPAFDFVNAYQCCCYPHIDIVHTPGRLTHLPHSLLESLTQQVRESRCHLVAAAPPEQAGQQLRVSTTFLEKQLMRNLTDLQGQLFILLKYLIKKVISEQVKGLKTYHAKCLVFCMVDETPAADWQTCNLILLTKRALEKLLHNLQSREFGGSECMRHFFLRDAIVYLKSEHNEKEEIVQALTHTIDNLTSHLTHFKHKLKPLHSQSSSFYFHPFLNIPYMHMQLHSSTQSQSLNYHEVYSTVRDVMLQVSQEDCTLQSLTEIIQKIPDCATTARETLRAVAFLKFNKREDAVKILLHIRDHSVTRGITIDMKADKVTKEMIWQHLNSSDSAWKFCFYISERPTFPFLPQFIIDNFTIRINNYDEFFFVNFDAVKKCLMLELIGNDISEAETWFADVLKGEDTDVQELMMILHYCSDMDLLVQLIHSHSRVIVNHVKTRYEMLRLMMTRYYLAENSSLVTLNELKRQLGSDTHE